MDLKINVLKDTLVMLDKEKEVNNFKWPKNVDKCVCLDRMFTED